MSRISRQRLKFSLNPEIKYQRLCIFIYQIRLNDISFSVNDISKRTSSLTPVTNPCLLSNCKTSALVSSLNILICDMDCIHLDASYINYIYWLCIPFWILACISL